MIKLNPEELVVSTFSVNQPPSDQLPTVDTNDPTPATHCDDCMSPTWNGCW